LTKSELIELVDRVYASWNQVVPHSSAKEIYGAWYRLLSDLELEECHQAVDVLAIVDNYMPRPGAVRKMVFLEKNKTSGNDVPPSPQEAWAILQGVAVSAANGAYQPLCLHACVSEALALLGGTAAFSSLHTNGDRNSFIEVYNKVVSAWENELAKIDRNKTTGQILQEENDRKKTRPTK